MNLRYLLAVLPTLSLACATKSPPRVAAPSAGNVFKRVGDEKTDQSQALQSAMDTLSQSGGGTLQLPRGNYLFEKPISVPPSVTLQGIWTSVPAHNGLRDPGLPK